MTDMKELEIYTRRKFCHLVTSFLGLGINSLAFSKVLANNLADLARDNARRTDEYRGYTDRSFRFLLVNYDYSEKREKPLSNTVMVYFKTHKQVLIDFQAPKNLIGRRILIEGRNMWISLPRTRRVIRLSPAERLLGQASNGDVVNADFNDYDTYFGEDVSLKGETFRRLILTARVKNVMYPKLEYWLHPNPVRPFRSLHYAASGKLLKASQYESFKSYNGHEFVESLLLVDPVFPRRMTRMIHSHYEVYDLPDSFFRKENLQGIRF